MRQRKVVILGSTGSIGTSAIKVAQDVPECMQVVGLAAGSNVESLARQALAMNVKHVCIYDESKVEELKALLPSSVSVLSGMEGLCELACLPEADMTLISIVGTAGLQPALAAIEAGKDLAVASKEILVMAGQIVMGEARKKGVHILPVDSEHNAIFQCLQVDHRGSEQVSRLIITASGGPFRTWEAEALEHVTLEQALNHPTWEMGRKITIDSATLFNKGLEMIEARWLFDLPMSKIEAIIHPQSIVHSMVEYVDGSVIAQMSHSDMCFPIQYAATWPDRVANTLPPLDFAALGSLIFEAPRPDVFPALHLARQAGDACGTLPAVFNAANEIAVDAFIHGKIKFPDIWRLVAQTMEAHDNAPLSGNLDQILTADTWARRHAKALVASF